MPVDPHGALRLFADDLDAGFDQLSDLADTAADLHRAAEVAGEHPAVVGALARTRDHLRHSLGMLGAASGKVTALRCALSGAVLPPAGPALPTEGDRAGGVYIGRQRAAQGAAQRDQ